MIAAWVGDVHFKPMIMHNHSSRRRFLLQSVFAGSALGLGLPAFSFNPSRKSAVQTGKRVGIIGLDTSHAPAFTKALNAEKSDPALAGYRVVAAYPQGSRDIVSSVERIPAYTEQVRSMGVEIVDSIGLLLSKVDVVLLETNDGRLHLEQARQVFAAGKPVFIDKPVAASLKDAVAIYAEAARYKVPVFSASSLRYTPNVQEAVAGKAGTILGADTFSPMKIEPTHPDLFWYGIHGVETLYTLMGVGCTSVTRIKGRDADVVTGVWKDGRVGVFRGIREGKADYGGTVYGSKGIMTVGPHVGYQPLLLKIIEFFQTGVAPVSAEETVEMFAFMEAADESLRRGGKPVDPAEMRKRVR